LVRDLAAFQQPLPPPYDACDKVGTRVSSLSLVRYRSNDYSVPTSYEHRDVFVRGYVRLVVIACGTETTARSLSGARISLNILLDAEAVDHAVDPSRRMVVSC
jgi:hypothetical protein